MNIYRAGTFVSQIDKVHCMSAAMQNMLNLIGPTVDRSAAAQRVIAKVALRLSNDSLDGGNGPNGWAAGLTQLGAGRVPGPDLQHPPCRAEGRRDRASPDRPAGRHPRLVGRP